MGSANVPYPATEIKWRDVSSSNVLAVGWTPPGYGSAMFVRYQGGSVYAYIGVTRQRVVAAARARSVGKYINRVIKPNFRAIKVVGL